MKHLYIFLIIVVSFLSVSAFTPQNKTQWEYKFDYKCNEKTSNELGAQGWEITGSSLNSYSNVITQMCIFRRAK